MEIIPDWDLFDRIVKKNNSKFKESDIANIIGQLLIILNCTHIRGYYI